MLIMHTVNKMLGGVSYTSWIITDLILIAVLVTLRITRKIKLEIVIGAFLYLWSVYAMFFYTEDTVPYSISFAYSIMIFFKSLKIKPIALVGASVFQVTLCSAIYTYRNEEVDKLFYCMFLTAFLCLIHYYIYHDEYRKNEEIQDRYQLTKDEMKIIKAILNPNPSNSRIADDLYMSVSDVKLKLGNVYTKFNIEKGGSKKTELVTKLARLGFIH